MHTSLAKDSQGNPSVPAGLHLLYLQSLLHKLQNASWNAYSERDVYSGTLINIVQEMVIAMMGMKKDITVLKMPIIGSVS